MNEIRGPDMAEEREETAIRRFLILKSNRLLAACCPKYKPILKARKGKRRLKRGRSSKIATIHKKRPLSVC